MYLLPDPRLVRLTSTAKVEDGLIEVTVWAVTMMPGLERRYSNVIYLYSGMISPLPTKYYNSEQKVPLLTLYDTKRLARLGSFGWGGICTYSLPVLYTSLRFCALTFVMSRRGRAYKNAHINRIRRYVDHIWSKYKYSWVLNAKNENIMPNIYSCVSRVWD